MPRDSIIFTDSRGSGLQDLIWANEKRNNISESILIKEIKGAGLRSLADAAISFSTDFPTFVVYIAGGICDVTWKNPTTKEIRFLHKDQAELTTHVTSILDEIEKRLHGCCPNTKFVLCPLVGVEVWKYIPRIATEIGGLQDMITNATIDINLHILRMNQKNRCSMPHLASPVHTWKHNRYYHHLELLAWDGIHLSVKLKTIWADQLIKAVERN